MTLDAPQREIGKPAFTVLSNAVSGVEVPGLQVELGGDAVFLNAEDDTGHAGIGLLVALLVLVVVFGTIVAALVPIGLSIVAVGAGIGAVTLLAGSMDVSASAIPIAGLVGLGVGIDYALFIVVRYRENRAAGQDDTRALGNAMGSSGAAVVFAGGTVVVATASLALTGLGGPHVHRPRHRADGALRGRGRRHPASGAARACSATGSTAAGSIRRHRTAVRPEDTAWWRFGHRVSGRPWPYLLGAVVVLVALATPGALAADRLPRRG